MNANSPTVLGLDIGGANLKAATAAQRAVSMPFALWKQPDALPAALASLAAQFPGIDEFAVTMTGELCDCYATKREGVNRILDAVEFAAAGRPVRIWGTGGNWLSVAEARIRTLEVAASNWHALATFAGRFAPTGAGLLIDIGSTTTDIIRLKQGRPIIDGRTDFDRLGSGELVYVGVKRTPIMALGLPNLCAEYFADVRDIHIVIDRAPEEDAATDTADGRPATRACSMARLARMLGGDMETLGETEIANFANRSFQRLTAIIANAVWNAFQRLREDGLPTVIMAGSGDWILRDVIPELPNAIISLAAELGPEISACAPAYAVAVLASEMPR